MAAAWIDARWPVPARVRGFTTLRHGLGVSAPPFDDFNLGLRAGDDAGAVERNRSLLVEHAHLPSPPCWLRQVHGVDVHRFDSPAVEEVEVDAAVTSEPGVVLAILTADCMPVLFSADDGSEIGAAHAGWRGLAGGVLENTLAMMRTAPGRVHAWMGPAAGPQAYEVGAEVFEAFIADDRDAADAFVSTRPNHWHVDLYALARRRFQAAGLASERIHGGGLCTISEPQRFFSHRRDQRGGRMASLLWIEPRE